MARFTLDLRKFAEKTGKKMDQVVAKIVIDIGTRIVERSPVGNPELWAINRGRKGKLRAPPGYVGGRFRANWQYATKGSGVPVFPLDDIDPTGQVSIKRISRYVTSMGAGHVHVLVNNLPYAVPLENGWSKQAPAGMVGLAIVEFQGIVESAADEVKHL